MSRPLVILIIAVVVVIVGLFVLAGRDTSVAPTRVEKAVTLENLS
jgi:hypothetical protein